MSPEHVKTGKTRRPGKKVRGRESVGLKSRFSDVGMLGHMALYIGAVLAANFTATWFIPLPVFGLLSVGTLIFGITFTQRDRVHHYGRKAVYCMIFTAAVGMVLESLFLGVEWRIIAASFIAIVLSETVDTEIYQRLLKLSWFKRVLGSNLVSIPLDSALFNLVAFAGVFAPAMLVSIIFGEIVSKFSTGALIALWRTQAAVHPPSPVAP